MLPNDISNNEGRIMFFPPDAGVMYKYRVYALGMMDIIEKAYDVNNQGMKQDNPYYDEGVNSVKSKVGTYVRPVDLVQACYLKFYGPKSNTGQIFDANGTEIKPVARILTNATYEPLTREPIDTMYTENVFVLPNGTYTYKIAGNTGSFVVTAMHGMDQDNGTLVRYNGETEMKYTQTPEKVKYVEGNYLEHDVDSRFSGSIDGDNVYYIGLDAELIPVTFTILNENSQIIPTVQRLFLGTNDSRPITLTEKVGIFTAYYTEEGVESVYMPEYADNKSYLSYNTTILGKDANSSIPEGSVDGVYNGSFFGDLNKNNNSSVGEVTVGMTSGTFEITATYPDYKLDLRHNHSIVLSETAPIDVVVVYMVKTNAYNFVKYDANGADGELPSLCQYKIWDGDKEVIVDAVPGVYAHATNSEEVVKVIKPDTLTKGDATFVGWNTKADGSGYMYYLDGAVNFDRDLDEYGNLYLYAIWSEEPVTPTPTEPVTPTPITTYTVSFERGVANETDLPETTTVEEGGSYTFPAYRAAAEGFIFNGWLLKDAVGAGLQQPGDVLENVTNDLVFVSQWTALKEGFIPTLTDLGALNNYLLEGGDVDPNYDLNDDGKINSTDLVLMSQYLADN